MSYPRHIQTLIVEDEQVPAENYRKLFEHLIQKKKLDLAPPVFARSYEHAIALLSTKRIFHLAIVDLELPMVAREPAQPGVVEPGIGVVKQAAAREEYPIPALLVISGRLDRTNIGSLNDVLKRDFWHGELVNKGVDQDDAIEAAIRKIHAYCDIGIHVRDAGGKLCPTLSPREEDLLRRCALSHVACMGLDLEWWGDCPGYSAPSGTATTGMTKVLMGRFLLRDGKESSRPSFFKFEPKADAVYSHEAVRIMDDKLGHVKLCGEIHSSSRSLLVTQQVGGSSERPISLAELLADPSDKAYNAIPHIISEIAEQIGNLGTPIDDCLAVSALVWRHHNLENVKSAWKRYGGNDQALPVQLLQNLLNSQKQQWARRRNCTHGDLNATNIALEASTGGYRAYIFDPGAMQEDTAGRDLAMLETTVLLHCRQSSDQSLIDECSFLYTSGVMVPDLPPAGTLSPRARNVSRLIQEIRKQAARMNDDAVYALMVFDCAMMQLGGLTLQSRGNKIVNPRDAVRLADLTAWWLQSVAPALVALPSEAGPV